MTCCGALAVTSRGKLGALDALGAWQSNHWLMVTSGNMLWARHTETSKSYQIIRWIRLDNRSNANICDVYFGTLRWIGMEVHIVSE